MHGTATAKFAGTDARAGVAPYAKVDMRPAVSDLQKTSANYSVICTRMGGAQALAQGESPMLAQGRKARQIRVND